MRRHGFGLIETVVILAIVVILAAILMPVFSRTKCNDRRTACQRNLKLIAYGMKQYIQDYNERYPPISLNNTRIGSDHPFGWADGLQPYLKSVQVLQCPSEPTGPNPDPTQVGYTDYWYNANCDRRS